MLDAFTTLVDGLDHPEGVAWAPDGRLYAGGELGQLYAVTLDGDVAEVASTGGFILGVAVDASCRIYACDPGNQAVMRIDPRTAAVEVYSAGSPDRPMRNPNFPTFAPDGTLYVTDSGTWKGDDGVVYRIAPDGSTEVWCPTLTRFPNGCALAPDGTALYVAESLGPGVASVPIDGSGEAGEPEPFVGLPGAVTDGLAFDEEGSLYVSCYRPDRIYRVSPSGEATVLADDPEGTVLSAPTNIAFCGTDLRSLVAANLAGRHLAVASVEVAGARLAYPELP